MTEKHLEGKVALVTGGTRGIGMAIVKKFLSQGANVITTGTQPHDLGPHGCKHYVIDFSDSEKLDAFLSEVEKLDADILVNNAGINIIGPFEKIPFLDFEKIQKVNIQAPFRLCQAVVPAMKRKGWGRIINIGSIFGIVGKEFRASYSASKFALDGFNTALAAEVAQYGILANCVAPGFIDTELTRRILGETGIADLVSKVPMKRLGKPEEIAAFVAWLAGPENTFISGQNIAIDGGFTRV